MAFGNESGLAIIDYIQKTCLLNLGTPDLYGEFTFVYLISVKLKFINLYFCRI